MRVLSVRSEKLFFTVRVIVYLLKSIGLALFSVPNGKPSQINPNHFPIEAFFYSNVGFAYNILLLIPVTVLPTIFGTRFFPRISSDGRFMLNILSIIRGARIFLYIFTSCLVIISWAFKQKNAASVLNRLLEIDVRLSGLKKQPFSKQDLISLALHITLNACLWITSWVATIIYFDNHALLVELLGKLPGFIIYWFIMEYITVVGLVTRDFETVNKYLLDFKQFGVYLSRPLVRNGILVVNVSNPSSNQIASLKVLLSVRTTLFEICEEIADFFSLPILFCIAFCFIPIFENLYSISQVANDFPAGLIVCWTLGFVLKFIYPIVSLTLNVTRTRKEAESTGQIVRKLLAESNTEEIKAELEQFSVQLLHEKVNFTAYGFFSLDSTLLQSMLGGVASYAIILMQFGSSICNCNCKSNGTSAE